MIVTAFEYEQTQGIDLEDFFRTTEGKFVHPEVRQWDQQLRAARDKYKHEKNFKHESQEEKKQRAHASKVLVTDLIEGESEEMNLTIFRMLARHYKGFKVTFKILQPLLFSSFLTIFFFHREFLWQREKVFRLYILPLTRWSTAPRHCTPFKTTNSHPFISSS